MKRINENSTWRRIDESWIGDKMKDGWEKVKDGAKKAGKAIGDVFNGPFRKGDQIQMSGEDGEKFKGTIADFDMGKKTYTVLLGNAVAESLEEDVLDMPDRVEELEEEIEKAWVSLEAHGADVDRIMQLVQNYIELYKIEPERTENMLGA